MATTDLMLTFSERERLALVQALKCYLGEAGGDRVHFLLTAKLERTDPIPEYFTDDDDPEDFDDYRALRLLEHPDEDPYGEDPMEARNGEEEEDEDDGDE